MSKNNWQPIETAPKDESQPILLYRPIAWDWGEITLGRYNLDQKAKNPKPFWEILAKGVTVNQSRKWEPTHWMELPDAPKDNNE